jgi:hypothetical protein
MKAVVIRGHKIMNLNGDGMSNRELAEFCGSHRLERLLQQVRHVFRYVGWEWSWSDPQVRTFKDVTTIIRDLDKVDPQSSAFRYPSDKKGRGSVPEKFMLNLESFVTVVEPLVEAFGTAAFGLDAEYDMRTD